MKMNIKYLSLKALNLAFVFSIMTTISFAQAAPDLYAYIVIQDDSDVGSPADGETMKELLESIEHNVPGMNVHVKYIEDVDASKTNIQHELQNTNIDNNDVVWYYYSGHGRNYNDWPRSDEHEIPLTWVHEQLKATGARLSIAMYDCCSVSSRLADPPSDIVAKSAFYKFLFLETSGNIIAASCSPRQLSYGHHQSGGIYTNAFIDAIKSSPDWESVFAKTKQMTTDNARGKRYTQVPISQVLVNTEESEPAPSMKTKDFNSLNDMVEEMNNICKDNKIYVKITVADILRWNEFLTRSNFKTFKKLKFNPHDPKLKKT